MAFEHVVPIRFRDVDAFGHVNNAVFLSYCEVARQAYFLEHFAARAATDFAFILARAEVDYLRPLRLESQSLLVRMTVPRVGKSSWDFGYELLPTSGSPSASEAGSADPESGAFARALTVQVYFDHATGSKAPVPGDWRSRFERIAGE